MKIGAQTITWGEGHGAYYANVLDHLARMGYTGVETGIRHFVVDDPVLYQKMFADRGLTPLGVHSGGRFQDPEAAEEERRRLDGALKFAAEIGFRWMVVSGNKGETVESMKRAAEWYSRVAASCAEAGIGFAYHNHDWEITHDQALLTTLFDVAGDDVKWVLDAAWCLIAGADPAELFARYRDRVAYVHIKDVREGRFTELGTGEVELPGLLGRLSEENLEWLVVEQDYSELPAPESLEANFAYLKNTGHAGTGI